MIDKKYSLHHLSYSKVCLGNSSREVSKYNCHLIRHLHHIEVGEGAIVILKYCSIYWETNFKQRMLALDQLLLGAKACPSIACGLWWAPFFTYCWGEFLSHLLLRLIMGGVEVGSSFAHHWGELWEGPMLQPWHGCDKLRWIVVSWPWHLSSKRGSSFPTSTSWW